LTQIKSLINNYGVVVEGPFLLTPSLNYDERGFFLESWNQIQFNSLIGTEINFVLDAHSQSKKGVLRGMHYQIPPNQQGKLVRCIVGEIYDVIVDIRKGSSTFSSWIATNISSKNFYQLWIPPGFAHGFLTLSDKAEVLYKLTDLWNPESERSMRWDDRTISIKWPKVNNLEVSEKDSKASFFNELKEVDFF
jgi:dTDP-4-dehydrorhamnose 3,5-epimerase